MAWTTDAWSAVLVLGVGRRRRGLLGRRVRLLGVGTLGGYLHLADDWLASQYRKAAEVIDALTQGTFGSPFAVGTSLNNAAIIMFIAAGFTVEEIENVLAPMAEDGKEALASMGDDTPPAVLSAQYRPLSHFGLSPMAPSSGA